MSFDQEKQKSKAPAVVKSRTEMRALADRYVQEGLTAFWKQVGEKESLRLRRS